MDVTEDEQTAIDSLDDGSEEPEVLDEEPEPERMRAAPVEPGAMGAKPVRRRGPDKKPRKITPAGLGQGRPSGRAGSIPTGVEESNDADFVWARVKEEIEAQNLHPSLMEIRVKRLTPPPSEPMGTIDCAAVCGDQNTSAATALRNFMIDYIHMQSTAMGPALYELWFCWKNKAALYARGELSLPSKQECESLRSAARMAQGAQPLRMGPQYVPPPGAVRGFGAEPPAPPSPPMPPSPPQPYWPGYAAAPAPSFDPEAERRRIREELDREYEQRELRRELEMLREEKRRGFGAVPGYAPPPPVRGYQRGGGRMPPPPPPMPEYDDAPLTRGEVAQIAASAVTQALQQAGVIRTPQSETARATGLGNVSVPAALDPFDQVLSGMERFEKLKKRMRALTDDGEERLPPPEQQAAEEQEEPQPDAEPKFKFVPTGQRWRDGREIMLPIDRKTGDPIMPTESLPAALTFGLANPLIGETIIDAVVKPLAPVFKGIAERMQSPAARLVGAGGVQVAQAQPQAQPQPQPQPTPLPPAQTNGASHHQEPEAAPAPASDDGWNFG